MITLTVSNSTSHISGLSDNQMKELKQLLSYSIDANAAYFSGAYKQHRRYLIDKRGFFATGLMPIVEKYLWDNKIANVYSERRKRPNALQQPLALSLGVVPYAEQINAAMACVERYRGIVCKPTGTGKSLTAALIINALQVRVLVVVPSLELKRQLTETMRAGFGDKAVGAFNSSAPIAVENVDALDPKVKAEYDCVIIDEFHRSGSKTYRNLNKKSWTDIFYRFGITATPFRSNENERLLLESVLSEVIYRLEYKTAVDKGYIVPIEPYFYRVPTTSTETDSYGAAYSELIVNKKERNEIICDLIAKLHFSRASTLVLVQQIAHGEALQAMLAGYGLNIPFANGQDAESRQMIADFNAKKHPTLIGSSILSEGVDTRPCEWVILAGGSGKSKGQLMQACGRAVRRYPGKESAKIISFYDGSHKWFKKHHAFFVKVMKEEYGVSPVRLFP